MVRIKKSSKKKNPRSGWWTNYVAKYRGDLQNLASLTKILGYNCCTINGTDLVNSDIISLSSTMICE